MATESEERVTFETGSGNVFEDLGFEDPEAEELRALLALALERAVRARGLKQKQAAHLLGIHQPHVSRLLRGHTEHFSAEKLLELMTRLGYDAQITFVPTQAETGRMRVLVAQ